MIQYTDIKEARRELRNLQNIFRGLQHRQEHLRAYIKKCNNEDVDVRKEIYTNRKMLNGLDFNIRKLNGNIVKLDKEITKKDLERQIKVMLEEKLKNG
jgi:chromosome segregation ATPase